MRVVHTHRSNNVISLTASVAILSMILGTVSDDIFIKITFLVLYDERKANSNNDTDLRGW